MSDRIGVNAGIKKFKAGVLCFMALYFMFTVLIIPANASDIFYIKNIDGTIYCNKGSWPDKTSGSSPDINTLINNNVKNFGDAAYIAAGEYTVNKTIELKAGVKLYGGFADDNSENTPDERKFNGVTSLDAGENCRVIECQDSSADNDNTRLDGFVITGGSTDKYDEGRKGGGLYNNNGASPTIANCVFINNKNKISSQGAAIYNTSSNAKIINCAFIENSAYNGGAVYNSSSGVTIINCTFKNNSAIKQRGGAIYINGDNKNENTLINCLFYENTALEYGGAIYNREANSIIKNCTFIDNKATHNGAEIYNESNTYDSLNHEISNTVIYHSDDKNVIFNNDNKNTITFKNCAIPSDFKITGGTVQSSDNIYLTDQDIFELNDELGECGITHTVLKFNKDSRLVNSGANSEVETDQLGRPRGLKIDIGSFEYQPEFSPEISTDMSFINSGTFTPEAFAGKSFDVELKDIADKWEITGTLPSWLIFEQLTPLKGRFTCDGTPNEGTFTVFMNLSNSKGSTEYNFTLKIASKSGNNNNGGGGSNGNNNGNNQGGNNNGVGNNDNGNDNDSNDNSDSNGDNGDNANENNNENGDNGDDNKKNNNKDDDDNSDDKNNGKDENKNNSSTDDDEDDESSGCGVNSGAHFALLICLAPIFIKKFKI